MGSERPIYSEPPERSEIAKVINRAYLAAARHSIELRAWLRFPVGPLIPKYRHFHESFTALWTLTVPHHELRSGDLHEVVQRWLESQEPITPQHAVLGLALYAKYVTLLAGSRIIKLH